MGALSGLLSFEKLITPTIIKIVYFIGIVVLAIVGVVGFFVSLFGGSFLSALGTLVGAVVGILLTRIYCELLMVMFGIYDRAGEIRDRLPMRS